MGYITKTYNEGYRGFSSQIEDILHNKNNISKHLLETCEESIRDDVLLRSFRSMMASAHYLSWKNLPFTTDLWKVVRGELSPEQFLDNKFRVITWRVFFPPMELACNLG